MVSRLSFFRRHYPIRRNSRRCFSVAELIAPVPAGPAGENTNGALHAADQQIFFQVSIVFASEDCTQEFSRSHLLRHAVDSLPVFYPAASLQEHYYVVSVVRHHRQSLAALLPRADSLFFPTMVFPRAAGCQQAAFFPPKYFHAEVNHLLLLFPVLPAAVSARSCPRDNADHVLNHQFGPFPDSPGDCIRIAVKSSTADNILHRDSMDTDSMDCTQATMAKDK